MFSWALSKLFPPSESIYHVYRRETKKIPVMTPSQAWAYYLHMRKGISADSLRSSLAPLGSGIFAIQIYKELGGPYTREFRHTRCQRQ